MTLKRCLKEIARTEGVAGFYRGIMSPIVGRAPMMAVLFGGREKAIRNLEAYDPHMDVNKKMILSGVFAGFFYAHIAFIFDLLKVRKQSQLATASLAA